MKKAHHSMLQGPLLFNIITYTIPIILTNALQLLFNAADLVIVGRFHGSICVAAVSATSAITNLIVNLFIGLSLGAGVTVAHALGSRENDAVHKTVHTALPTALISGILLTLIGIFFSEKFLLLMGTPESILPLSTVYMKIYFSGITFTMVYNFCASILRAVGDTKNPLIYLTVSGVINVILNIIFVTVFNMNVEGVAYATVISQGISAVLVVVALIRRTDACKLDLSNLHIYMAPLLKMLRIGLPAGIQRSLFAISNVIIQTSVNSFGDILMSGNGAASSLESFINVIPSAFHQTAVNFIGQNTGAHQYKRVKQTYGICLACSSLSTLFICLLCYRFAPNLLSLYITDSQEAIAYGVIRLTYTCLPYFTFSLMDITTGAIRGMGASFTPMLISVLGVCGIRIAWIYSVFQIPAYHTPENLYLSYPISWVITFICHLIAFHIIYCKRVRQDTLAR